MISPTPAPTFLDRSTFGEAHLNPAKRNLKTPTNLDEQKIAQTAKDFEGLVMGFFLNLMFKNVGENNLFGGGHGEETFKSLLVEEYGKSIANGAGIGIAEVVQKQLILAQQNRDNHDEP